MNSELCDVFLTPDKKRFNKYVILLLILLSYALALMFLRYIFGGHHNE